jgi:hypothetical protein
MRIAKFAEISIRQAWRHRVRVVASPNVGNMSTKYFLQKIPVESVQPGFSLAIHQDGGYRLFQVECTQMSQRAGQPAKFRLTSEPVNGSEPWVLECEAGTPVVRILGVCGAAS